MDTESLLSFQAALRVLKRLEHCPFLHRARSEDRTGGAGKEGRAGRAGRAGKAGQAGALRALKRLEIVHFCTEPEVRTE